MTIELFMPVLWVLIIISTQVSYFVNDRIFHITGVFSRQYASWGVAVVVSTIFWAICKLYGIELPFHYAIITIGIAGCSNGYYDIRHSPY